MLKPHPKPHSSTITNKLSVRASYTVKYKKVAQAVVRSRPQATASLNKTVRCSYGEQSMVTKQEWHGKKRHPAAASVAQLTVFGGHR